MSRNHRLNQESPGSSRDHDWQIQLEETLRLIPGFDPWDMQADSWLDHESAQQAIDFFHECLRHVEGGVAGQPFVLQPWQQAIIGNIFGWKRRDNQGRIVRRFRETFIYIPRKNGKTPLAAGICNYLLFCDGEIGAQIYCAAADREQASLLYRHAKGMIESEEELLCRARIYRSYKSIVLVEDEASVFRVLSADADTKHGGNPHGVVVDELHAQPKRDLVDVLQTSFASQNRAQPLLVFITTADFDRESICNEKYEEACRVRDNGGDPAKPGYDPAFLPVIYEALPGDDWTSPDVWRKCNPNLGVSVSLEYLERECRKAIESPGYANTFKRLHLNIRTKQDVLWIPMEAWDRCGGGVPLDQLLGRECYAGLDLANRFDINALALLFPSDDGVMDLRCKFWMPNDVATRKDQEGKDGVSYLTWARDGWITLTPGDVTDYEQIQEEIKRLTEKFVIREIAYDPYNATQMAINLATFGIEVVEFHQNTRNFNEPTKAFDGAVREGILRHDGNPVLRWMAQNAAVKEDNYGNIRPVKPPKKSNKKVDGIVASIMALARAGLAKNNTSRESVYESRGVLVI